MDKSFRRETGFGSARQSNPRSESSASPDLPRTDVSLPDVFDEARHAERDSNRILKSNLDPSEQIRPFDLFMNPAERKDRVVNAIRSAKEQEASRSSRKAPTPRRDEGLSGPIEIAQKPTSVESGTRHGPSVSGRQAAQSAPFVDSHQRTSLPINEASETDTVEMATTGEETPGPIASGLSEGALPPGDLPNASREIEADLSLILTRLGEIIQDRNVCAVLDQRSGDPLIQRLITQINHLLDDFRLASDELDRLRTEFQGMIEDRTRKLDLVAKGASDGVWIWDLRTDSTEFSGLWLQSLGFDTSDFATISDWLARIHLDDHQTIRAELRRHIEGLTDLFFGKYRIRAADGRYRWMSCRARCLRDDEGRPIMLAGSQIDIHDAETVDHVTGLQNDRSFREQIKAALARSETFQVLIVGVPRAARVYEGLDASLIDALRVTLAQRLSASLPFDAVLARLTGDNHGVILPVGPDGTARAESVGSDLIAALSEPFEISGRTIWLDAVIGATGCMSGASTPSDLLRDAWSSYRCALGAGVRFNTLSEAQVLAAQRRIELERDIRDALLLGWFVPYLQPILDLQTGEVRGFEALVRMVHPELGIVSPGVFLPVAQSIGLKADISFRVLEKALELLEHWKDDPILCDLFISVNLDAAQMMHKEFPSRMEEKLWEKGISPGNIKIEIVESSIIESFSHAAKQIQELREIGIKIALDDFGTGYSSLEYLSQLDVDLIKIDRSFVDGMETDLRKQSMVKTICLLSDSLGAEICMEGVETEDQLNLAKDFQIDLIQGYYYSKPLPVEKARAYATDINGGGIDTNMRKSSNLSS